MSLLAQFNALNSVNLSTLRDRLAALRADMERDLALKAAEEAKASNPDSTTVSTVTVRGDVNSLTAEQLIAELKKAQRSAS